MTRPEDAAIAEGAGAGYIGAVLVPGSPRCVSPDDAARIGGAVSVPLVIVIADLSEREAIRAAERAGAGVIQLHGGEPPEHLEALRDAGDWELWKAVRVRSGRDLPEAAEKYASVADLLLLDGWHPSRLGGTGTAFSWDDAASARAEVDDSVRLGVAGGLDPENVAEAVTRLRPDLADVSSGVESAPGVKDGERVREFVRRALTASGRGAGESP